MAEILLRPRPRTAPPEPLAVSVADAAARIGISERHLGTFIRTGAIASSLIGRRRVITIAELSAFLEKNTRRG